MEARTRAAEEQVEMYSLASKNMRREMQRQIDETRERLNVQQMKGPLVRRRNLVAHSCLHLTTFNGLSKPLAKWFSRSLARWIRAHSPGIRNALAAIGVEPVKSVGERFDPEKHEAVDTVEVRVTMTQL